jgi:hypothetical protein
MITEEQKQEMQQEVINILKELTVLAEVFSAKLNATTIINQLTARLDQATKDNNSLLQFIKSKGLQPPQLYEA